MDGETCAAMNPAAERWEVCGAPAVAIFDYGCEHEHVKRRASCAAHEPAAGAVGCRDCWELGHDCPMLAREVARL